jgi:hypothetical protein
MSLPTTTTAKSERPGDLDATLKATLNGIDEILALVFVREVEASKAHGRV